MQLMQLANQSLSTALLMAAACVSACGASNDATDELRNELAGFYSSSLMQGQVDPPNARIKNFEFLDDGSGTYHRLSCTGEISNEHVFEWTLDDEGLVAKIVFGEDYVNADGVVREGTWQLPDDGCSEATVAEFNFDGIAGLTPGRGCNPQLGLVGTEGLRECEFELCGGESLRCGGAEEEE